MAVHVPLSEEAKAEARILMLGSNNILSPKNGDPIVTPSQDMILGNYYITMEKAGLPGEGRVFKNSNEALMAYQRREIKLQTRIAIPVNSFKHKVFLDSVKNKYLVTTPGKIIFNEILPDSFPYLCESTSENIEGFTPSKYFIDYGENIPELISNMPLSTPFNKGALEKIIAQMFKRYKTTETSIFLDKLKDLGILHSLVLQLQHLMLLLVRINMQLMRNLMKKLRKLINSSKEDLLLIEKDLILLLIFGLRLKKKFKMNYKVMLRVMLIIQYS